MLTFIAERGVEVVGALAFFVLVLLATAFLVVRMFALSRKEALAALVVSKTKGIGQRANSAILSVENAALRNAGRTDKLPFELVNWLAIKRDLRKAGLPAFPPLVLLFSVLLAFFVAAVIVAAPVDRYPLWLQWLAVAPPCYYVTRVSLINTRIDARKMRAMTQLIAFVESVQRAVSVGASPEEAVIDAIKDSPQPLKSSLLSVKDLIELGYDFVDAINLASDRVDLREFDIFAASITAQASTGGTIGDVLREVVDITRSRVDLQKKIATMTGEGRFNAMLLGSLPIGLIIYLRNVQADYAVQIWDPRQIGIIGPLLYFATLAMAVLGAFLAMRIAKISI